MPTTFRSSPESSWKRPKQPTAATKTNLPGEVRHKNEKERLKLVTTWSRRFKTKATNNGRIASASQTGVSGWTLVKIEAYTVCIKTAIRA